MRFALYFTPSADAVLTRIAADWLGRDAFAGVSAGPPSALEGLSVEELRHITAAPRRYGFHATLVAPFRLRDDIPPDDLARAVEAFAASRRAFTVDRLAITRIGGFLALTPAAPSPKLNDLAAAAVEALGPFRAPLTEAEIARRDPARLSPRQRDYLERYGYPYVMEEFRFHMTLTDSLSPPLIETAERAARTVFPPHLLDAVPVDAVALFVEPMPGAAFAVRSLHCFGT